MEQLDSAILSKVIQQRPTKSHKGTFGRAVLVGGNRQFGGAILMAAQACVYGGTGLTTVISDGVNRTALHARSLAFVHPVRGRQVRFEAPLPDDLKRLIGQLRARSGTKMQYP